MKRIGNLWEQITNLENIRHAHQLAKRGKNHYTAVKQVDANFEPYMLAIQNMLANRTFTTSKYRVQDRFVGGKMRRIFKLPYYPDRIVQHAVFSIVGPIITRSLIRDTFQSLPGRGTSDARRRIQKLMRSANPPAYAMKVDVEKFYPSINNYHMREAVKRKIKCPMTLWVINDIIDSHVGLPIGNLSSQYLGNLYLNQFDWWVKQTLKPDGYYRYADDLVLFAGSKLDLRLWKKRIDRKLEHIGLKLKANWQIYDVSKQGVDFVGYVFSPNRTRIRRSIAERFIRKAARYDDVDVDHAFASLVSYRGWLMRANAKRLWRKYVTSGMVRHFDGFRNTNPLRRAL